MKRQVWLGLALFLSSILVSAQTRFSDEATSRLIDRVKQTPASQLDSTLPTMPFERWLQHEAGDDATVAWVVRTSDDSRKSTPSVEADVLLHGRPGIVIMISNEPFRGGLTRAKFRSLELVRAHEHAEWNHLRDLPEARKRAGAERKSE